MNRSRSKLFATAVAVAIVGIITVVALSSKANARVQLTPTLFRMWLVDERASSERYNNHGKLWVDSESGAEYFETPSGSIVLLVDGDGKPSINEEWKKWKESCVNVVEHY